MSSIAVAPLFYKYAVVFANNPAIRDQTLWFDANLRTAGASPSRDQEITTFATTSLPGDLVAPDRPAAFRVTTLAIVAIGIALSLSRRGGWMRLGRSKAWRAGLFW